MLKSKDRTYEDVPTFKNYCKALTNFDKPIISYVHKIWLPNKYPSLTLTTDRFLLRIHQKSDIYDPLLECLEQWEESEACIFVRVLDPKALEFEIDCLETENSTWTDLGDFGKELIIRDKKPAQKKAKSKT